MDDRRFSRTAKRMIMIKILVVVSISVACLAQPRPASFSDSPLTNLPSHPVGINDLVVVSVYDAPEVSKSVRVGTDGTIRLPLVTKPIPAEGRSPLWLEQEIAAALRRDKILVDPVVTVTVADYASRPINVTGAVRQPQLFQAVGSIRLLDAVSKAGGLAENAGNEILITVAESHRRVPIKALFEGTDPSLNLSLSGGEDIRVLEAGRAFVVGTVKKPGAFTLRGAEQSTILQMVALAEGLLPFASKQAYIYRRDGDGTRKELVVNLDRILRRKESDVAVMPEDILYIPENRGRRMTATTIERLLGFGSAGASALVYSSTR